MREEIDRLRHMIEKSGVLDEISKGNSDGNEDS